MRKAEQLPPLVEQNLRELDAIEGTPIDLTDMPEVTDWSGARRGPVRSGFAPGPHAESVRIDPALLHWFRAHTPEGEDYATRIDVVLRAYVAKAGEREAA